MSATGDHNPYQILPFHSEGASVEVNKSLWVGRSAERARLLEHFAGSRPAHAAIVGPRGSGRTTLAQMLRADAEEMGLFPAGWRTVSAASLAARAVDLYRFPPLELSQGRHMLFIDDFEDSRAALEALGRYMYEFPSQDLLFATRDVPSLARDPLVVRLGGLSRDEFTALMERRLQLSDLDSGQVRELFNLVDGSPLFGNLAATTVRENLMTLSELVQRLRPFEQSGIYGPDGRPLSSLPGVARDIVVAANETVRERIRRNPGELRLLEPRAFEQLIAEILSEQGYEIRLTPQSRDGGFDMFAARRDDLGSFLYLVECKRYTPPRNVGVSVIRSLHGAVQKERANGGIVVTTSFFSRPAREYQEDIPFQLQLRDYLELRRWLGLVQAD